MSWLEENKRLCNCATISKFIWCIVREYIKERKKAKAKEETDDRPKTPREELDLIVEEMGVLEDRWHDKYEALRSLIPEDAKPPEKDSDLKPLMERIWQEVIKQSGFVENGKGKGVSITREDLANYEKVVRLNLRKKQLQKEIAGVS
jgi:hypothetical protein